jgi:WXG100 family type VII secretion target
MGGIAVTPEQMRASASKFANEASNLEGMLSTLKAEIETLSGTWKGAAQMQFAELMDKWNRDVQDITDVLNTISQHLNQAAQGYEDADQGMARGFTS